MPGLDSCIDSIFEPGNPGNATDSGTITIPRYPIIVELEETAAATDSPDGHISVILSAAIDEAATAADAPDASVSGAPGRSAMVDGVMINSSAREANANGVMVNL